MPWLVICGGSGNIESLLECVEPEGILKFTKYSKVRESILLSRWSLKNLELRIRLRSARVCDPSASVTGE